jgi:DUF1365 family protein
MKNIIFRFSVSHRRLIPKAYFFKNKLFWFKLDLNDINKNTNLLLSYNRLNLYSFYDCDHLNIGENTAKENYIKFVRMNGFEGEIVDISIYTHLRVFGYVFNPMSLIFLKNVGGDECCIVEVGNTFNEVKPYFISSKDFNDRNFYKKFNKSFYISPFIEHDNEFQFHLKRSQNKMSININSFREQEKILEVFMKGKEESYSTIHLLVLTLLYPLITIKVMFYIHFHALFLYLKGIPFYKKRDSLDKQKHYYKLKKNI